MGKIDKNSRDFLLRVSNDAVVPKNQIRDLENKLDIRFRKNSKLVTASSSILVDVEDTNVIILVGPYFGASYISLRNAVIGTVYKFLVPPNSRIYALIFLDTPSASSHLTPLSVEYAVDLVYLGAGRSFVKNKGEDIKDTRHDSSEWSSEDFSLGDFY